MTIIAWDGLTIAADRQLTCGGLKRDCSKLQVYRGAVLAWSGAYEEALLLAEWYKSGHKRAEYPEGMWTDMDRVATLIVFGKSGIYEYQKYPVPQPVLENYMAWGGGADIAIGALAHGATAVEAVEITSKFDNGCGGKVDTFAYSRNPL